MNADTMIEFILYQGKVAIVLAMFYMFYRLLLSKETFHRVNRIMLIGTAALAFILPLCVITVKEIVVIPAMPVASETLADEMSDTTAMIPEVSEPIWLVVLCSLFALGALSVLIKIVVSIIGIKRIISSGSSQILESGETLIITENDTAPFSWMKYIVISREDYENDCEQILTHEKAHIALRHSWDILFVDMITALQWFNPAIWMLKADLRALHEFEADDAVLRSGANIKEYQYLLIRKAVGKSGYSVANSFNHSTLKARITMMLNKKSSRTSAWKALYVIPIVGISLAATAETKVDYRFEDAQTVSENGTPEGKDTKSFKQKNMYEGRFILDKENCTATLICYDINLKECRTTLTNVDFNSNVFIVNGRITDEAILNDALKDDNVVLINSYLDNGKKICAAVTPTENIATGRFTVVGKEAHKPVRIGKRNEEGKDVDVNEILVIVNGEKMEKGFDFNRIDPTTIEKIEVITKKAALEKYGEENVISVTVDPSKKQSGKRPKNRVTAVGTKVMPE